MAQSTILAAGQTAADATDVTVASGGSATLSIFASAGQIPDNIGLPVYLVEPGGILTHLKTLHSRDRAVQVTGPGVYRVKRELITAYGINVGVASDV